MSDLLEPALRSRWRVGFATAVALGAAAYAMAPPRVPDLAAQVARTNAGQFGAHLWWTGWYGGLQLPGYSVLSPMIMSTLGVTGAAVLAAVAACLAGLGLFRGAARPRLGAAVFAVAVFSDVVAGRVTFALGLAAAMVTLALLGSRKDVWAFPPTIAAVLLSPLAGLFLGIATAAVAVADPARRRTAAGLTVLLGITGAALAVVFGNPGRMGYPLWHLLVAELTVGVVAVLCPGRIVRAGAALTAGALLLFFALPGPVGTNVVRLVWVAAAPVLAACGTWPRRRAVVAALAVGACVWPMADLGVQLAAATEPAADKAFYLPLVNELHSQRTALGIAALGQRVEVIDTATHWSSVYVAEQVPIARGWDRQADRVADPLFYDGRLTAARYHRWLSGLAVGWVALPRSVPLDYASRSEARLVASGLGYLRPVWRSEDWELFRVRGASQLVRGAGVSLIGVDAQAVRFRVSRPAAAIRVQVRWSPYLTLSSRGEIVPACITSRGAWTTVRVGAPGTYTLAPRLRLDRDGTTDAGCVS